ncbi:Retrovirus-related Pol polyprotein from transposon 412 [Araneus ventricosus]|uniref:Retrovirus-related Pol polyprotein from transposon 412 n=1 Tax=Araneus ventricosus TaxID=182803 RepID=A0A4Y2I113_ARAVE|nr:Retrovirus-related Pol polyprotein from transposon 412 [Araneus ventricosus]
MDFSTKWLEAIPIPYQEASTVAEELVRAWISRYGVPMILHSDQGTNFNSALFTEFCKLLGILKTRTTALHPESDGMVEKFNRTILNQLSLFVSKNQTDWDTHLPLFLLAYRSAGHEVTGFTSADMLFGRTLRLPCDIPFGRPSDTPSSSNEYLNNFEACLESVHAFARERIKLASERLATTPEQQTIILRREINGLIHHPWLNHDQRLNDGSAIIMRKVTEMHCQMYTLLGCYIGMVSQFLCCWRFLKLPSAFEPNEFLANSPVRGYIQPIISVSIRLFV